MQIEEICDSFADLGEGPHWDSKMKSLYYVDMWGGTLFRFDYCENKTYKAKIENEEVSSFIIPIKNRQNHFAVGLRRRVGDIEWNGRSSTAKVSCILFEVEEDGKHTTNRFNDGKADPMGRLFAGTMRSELDGDIFEKRLGSLYRFEKEQRYGPTRVLTDIGISNGLAWDMKMNKFYHIDSVDLNVKEYDYDNSSGNISNPKILVEFTPVEKLNFVPDGMTIDSVGNLYVALIGASKIIKINTTCRKITKEIMMPTELITSLAFGGPNLNILYVTTAKKGIKSDPAGKVFKITGLDSIGLEMNKLEL